VQRRGECIQGHQHAAREPAGTKEQAELITLSAKEELC
jgi:hypothetical protein